MAYAEPQLLESSPTISERNKKLRAKNDLKRTFWGGYDYPAIKNSIRWGFTIGTIHTFLCLYLLVSLLNVP